MSPMERREVCFGPDGVSVHAEFREEYEIQEHLDANTTHKVIKCWVWREAPGV